MELPLHFEKTATIDAAPKEVFDFVDDHERLSSHMSESSWMMGGGMMKVDFDEGRGRRIGSHIRMSGKAFGMSMSLDEVVTVRDPPGSKSWETVGKPELLIIGNYRMGVRVLPAGAGSVATVFIDYELPSDHPFLGRLLARPYAKWCVSQMTDSIKKEFDSR